MDIATSTAADMAMPANSAVSMATMEGNSKCKFTIDAFYGQPSTLAPNLASSSPFLRRSQKKFDRYPGARNVFLEQKEYINPRRWEKKLIAEDGKATSGKEGMLAVVLERSEKGLLHMVQLFVSCMYWVVVHVDNGKDSQVLGKE
ncbi:hypothetical protein LOCC1_G000477 [Lachnellula occidentalis]|uniref:Uncharacterized protein n=1 Tax=Lachnellula occidentalis TaxID=215460 RepID=A0A8H8SC15_9HELO|nr:hypothetical protein LOCC1_G000477 [Lachnellula occidentalis]